MGIQGPGIVEEDHGGCSSGGGGDRGRKADMRFLHPSRSAGMKLRGTWRGSYGGYALGMPDLFRSNDGVFVFLHTRNPHFMHISAQSFTGHPQGGQRQEPRGV